MKNITVITRFKPRQNNLDNIRKWLDDWTVFLNQNAGVSDLEVLVLTNESVCWIESWKTKELLDKFNREHLVLSDFMSRLTAMSYPEIERDIYKKIQ